MKISVITVCLNATETISSTIESVLREGVAVHEFLVIDGGSTDGTLEILQRFEPRFEGRMRWLSEPDDGLYHAMNRGLELVDESALVLFLGADDVVVAGSIGAVVEAAGLLEDVDLVYGDVRVREQDGSWREQRALEFPKRIGDMPRSMPVCHQATLFSARAYRQLGGFDTEFRVAADYEFYLRFIEAGMRSVYVPVAIAEFRLGGVSSSRAVATADEYRRAWVLHGVSPILARTRMAHSVLNLRIARALRRVTPETSRSEESR